MAYWRFSTMVCCTVGYFLSARHQMDRKVGVGPDLSFSVLVDPELYNEKCSCALSLKLMLLVFLVLFSLTLLLLLDRYTLIAWLKLASLLFLLSMVSGALIPDPNHLKKAEATLNHLAQDAPDMSPVVSPAERRARALTETLSKKPATPTGIRSETLLHDVHAEVSEQLEDKTWGFSNGRRSEALKRFPKQIQILDETGRTVRVAYLDEDEIGMRIVLLPQDAKQLSDQAASNRPSPVRFATSRGLSPLLWLDCWLVEVE